MCLNFKVFLVGVVLGWFIVALGWWLYGKYCQKRRGYYPELEEYLRFFIKMAGVLIGLILVISLYLLFGEG